MSGRDDGLCVDRRHALGRAENSPEEKRRAALVVADRCGLADARPVLQALGLAEDTSAPRIRPSKLPAAERVAAARASLSLSRHTHSFSECGSPPGAQRHHRAGEPLCEVCQAWSDERHRRTRIPPGSRCGTPAGAQMHRQLGEKVCERCAPGRRPRAPQPLTGRLVVVLALVAEGLVRMDPCARWREPAGHNVSDLVSTLRERGLVALEYGPIGLVVTDAGRLELEARRTNNDKTTRSSTS